jgi:hypothetical protein
MQAIAFVTLHAAAAYRRCRAWVGSWWTPVAILSMAWASRLLLGPCLPLTPAQQVRALGAADQLAASPTHSGQSGLPHPHASGWTRHWHSNLGCVTLGARWRCRLDGRAGVVSESTLAPLQKRLMMCRSFRDCRHSGGANSGGPRFSGVATRPDPAIGEHPSVMQGRKT